MQIKFPSFHKLTIEDIINLPANDLLILTYSKGHASRIKLMIADKIMNSNKTKELPQILPLNSWIVKIFDDFSFKNYKNDNYIYFFDQVCEQILWDKVIREEESDNYLVNFDQASILALEAKHLIKEFFLNTSEISINNEHERFLQWENCYYKELSNIKAIDFDEVYELIIDSIGNKEIFCPKYIVFYGFTETSPRLDKLLNVFLNSGSKIKLFSPGIINKNNKYVCICDTIEEEWEQAADWISEQINKNPCGKYAIVSPQLDKNSLLARRILDNRLNSLISCFNIESLFARSCNDWPLINAAISWIQIFVNISFYDNCEIDLISKVLLKGYCIGDDSIDEYAHIESRIRSRYISNISLKDFLKELGDCKLKSCFLSVLPKWSKQSLIISSWINIIRFSLNEIFFPGKKTINSIGIQLFDNLDILFSKFILLESIFGEINSVKLLSLFKYFAKTSSFQTKYDSSIFLEVLDINESFDGKWDAIWVIGMNEDFFPAIPVPNPFIPISILKKSNVPRSTIKTEFDWSSTIYDSLLSSANNVVFSYSRTIDGNDAIPSVFLINAQHEQYDLVKYKQTVNNVPTETLNDDNGPAIDISDGNNIFISSNTLELQSRCPLWSFVRYRLGAHSLQYLNDIDSYNLKRGIVIHEVLYEFWRIIRKQSVLANTDSSDIDLLLKKCISDSSERHLYIYDKSLIILEKDRIFKLMKDILFIENRRLSFENILLEQNIVCEYNNLFFKIRPDRIDLTLDGKFLVIDYKTGNNVFSPEKEWFRERPINLQIPLYAMLYKEKSNLDVGAMLIFSIGSKKISIKGISNCEIGSDKLVQFDVQFLNKEIWNESINLLYRKICLIIEEYLSGYASNHYYSTDDLKYCDVMPFLRLDLDEL